MYATEINRETLHPYMRGRLRDPNKSRGKTLARAREDAGLGQAEAAEKLGIHRVSLSRIETGSTKKIDAELFARMRELYRMPDPEASLLAIDISSDNVSRETDANTVDREVPPAAVNEGPAPIYSDARVAPVGGRPHRIRKWLQTEMSAWVDANIPEDEFRAARQFLESEDTQGFFAGKDPNDRRTEEQILNDLKALAYTVRRSWRVRGFKIDQEPVE